MRSRALLFLCAVLLSGAAQAQVMWQPTEPPLVTADNETWYRAGTAIEWNGQFYYPAGAPEAFNRYQMVRAGSYRGIPLYTDTTLEPYSIVFVPIAGGRMQPYERPRAGMLAGSVGSRAPSFPTAPEQANALALTPEGFIAQAAAPPTFARAYDLAAGPERISPAVPIVGSLGAAPPVVAQSTAGLAATAAAAASQRPAATSGRTTTIANRGNAAARPRGTNTVWFDFNGRRWEMAGKAIDLSPEFIQIGQHRGSPIYQRRGDSSTLYVPSTDTLVVPYRLSR